MADELAAGPPLVFAAIKEIVREAENMKFQDALNRITGSQFETVERLYRSEDQLEGARAFAEGRDPVWKGRIIIFVRKWKDDFPEKSIQGEQLCRFDEPRGLHHLCRHRVGQHAGPQPACAAQPQQIADSAIDAAKAGRGHRPLPRARPRDRRRRRATSTSTAR
jgi:hypothetical protein